MRRRAFLTAAGATLVTTALTRPTSAAEKPPAKTTTPLPLGPLADSGSRIESLDKRFKVPGTATIERVATGFLWAEGPAYVSAGRYLVFSDIPNNRIMRFREDNKQLSVFRSPAFYSNGNTIDRQGRLVTCEHGGRRVRRMESDGSITVVVDRYNGKRLNSPNDLAVAADGSIWFTDPSYGIGTSYDGVVSKGEQSKNNVYRVDAQSGQVTVVVDDFVQPNGICFSPDGRKLYVADTGITHGGPAQVRVFDVDSAKGKATGGKIFVGGLAPALVDGMRSDMDGNIWCGIGAESPEETGVRCYSAQGELLGKIHLPETCANVAFGGAARNRLYMCANSSLYVCDVGVRGA